MATSFNLGGLLGVGEGLGDLLTPEQQSAIQQRGLLSAAAALLQAGGPSTTRTSLGQALGAAFTAGQTGAEKAQQSALTGMLTRQKLDEARRAREMDENVARILTGGQQAAPSAGGEITPDMALAAPVTPEMPAGPTVARAGMIGQAAPAAPAMTANEIQAQRYRDAARLYTSRGRTEDAKRMFDIADRLAPTQQEVVGDIYRGEGGKFFQRTKTGGVIEVPGQMAPAPKPIGSRETVTDLATGKEVIVQGYDDGSFKTIGGFGPKRDMVLQTVDGKTVAIDRSQVAAGETFGTGMSPLDYARLQIEREQLDIAKARLKLSQQEFDNKKYERADTPTGIVFYPTTPEGGPVIPLLDAEGKPVMGAVAEQLKIDRERLKPERIRILSAFGIEPTEENLRKFERKPMGQPQSVTELASGKQVLMQQFDDGTYQTVGGFGPPRRIEKVSLGGRVQFVDMNAVKPGSSLAMSLAPQVVGGAESGYYVVGGGGGAAPAAAQRAPAAAAGAPATGAPARAAAAPARVAGPQLIIPGTGGSSRPTEGESNAAGFAQRMERSQAVISGLPEGSQPGVRAAVAGALPVVGGVAQRRAMTAEQQQYKQAADDWIRAKLRKESGAVIGEDEMRKEYETYFPQIGDGPEVIAQKAQARAIATNSMKTSAGRAYQPYVPSGPKEGDTSKDRNGRNIIFRNGQWVYQ